MDIGENLKYLRKSRGLTQQEVADKINVTRQAYTNYEANKREPELKTLIKIADFYMVSIDMIVGRIKFQGLEQVSWGNDIHEKRHTKEFFKSNVWSRSQA